MKCTRQVRHYVHSVDVLVGVHVVKRHAIVDVQCVCLSSASSLVFTLLCFQSHLLLSTLSSQFSYCSSSSNSFSRCHFSHMFSLYSHGIQGVVFTPPVGYSRPPSAVNDPTVTKQVNSRKSYLEEVSQVLIRFP